MIRLILKSWLAGALITVATAAPNLPTPGFESLLIRKDGTSQRVFLVTATKASIRYRETKESTEIKDLKLSDLATVTVSEPKEYLAAVNLFQDRRYQEARQTFAELKVKLAPLSTLPGNPATLSAFYELECFRKLGDLNALAEGLKKFNKDTLVRENHLRQIEMYIFWDAVRAKNWGRLEALAKDRMKERLPGFQRAQVSYCHALALEELAKPIDALNAYQTALTADVGASEEIARKSAIAILRIHLADPQVKESLKNPSDPSSAGYPKLSEAKAVARLFELSLGSGEPLPEDYQVFLKD